MRTKISLILLLIYLSVFAICAIAPFDRNVWWAENIPIIFIVFILVITFKYYKFSPLSYILMSFFIILHTIGGHFTFERVPFDFVTNLFGFTRNNYDRLAHFAVGFYAYPLAELLVNKKLVRSKTILLLFPVFAIFTIASFYEIIEWLYAITAKESAGIAFLGSQGDIWDAQKDMLFNGLGALFIMLIFVFINRRNIAKM